MRTELVDRLATNCEIFTCVEAHLESLRLDQVELRPS